MWLVEIGIPPFWRLYMLLHFQTPFLLQCCPDFNTRGKLTGLWPLLQPLILVSCMPHCVKLDLFHLLLHICLLPYSISCCRSSCLLCWRDPVSVLPAPQCVAFCSYLSHFFQVRQVPSEEGWMNAVHHQYLCLLQFCITPVCSDSAQFNCGCNCILPLK